jgi:HK97 family phage major capsid protein
MATKLQDLEGAARKAAADARAIIEKADGGDLSAADRAEMDQHMAKARELLVQIKTVKADEAVMAEAKSIADLVGPAAAEAVTAGQGWGGDTRSLSSQKSLSEIVLGSAQFKSLLDPFQGRKNEFGLVQIPAGTHIQSAPIGVKSLFTGLSSTSAGAFVVNERTNIVETLGRRDLTLRDLISVRRTQSDTVEYVTQTSHTNSAAVVAEATSSAAPTTGASSGAALTLNAGGGYKPEGAWAYAVNSTTVKTIAEWVPVTKRALADVAQLEGLIRDELVADVKEAEEDQVLNGSGSGENITGILNTSGIQTQAATTTNDATWFASYRQAITKVEYTGRARVTGLVVNPAQAEKIDTSKDSQLRFYGNGPFGMGPRTLWGVPVVVSEAISAGTALLGDFSKAVLWDREQANISFSDSHADFFIRNLVAILAEERVAFGVVRPSAFCTVTGL